MSNMNSREIEIEAPWGKIAAKLWGNEKDEAILAVHGLGDNLGTFDLIIPLLPRNYFYISIDLPGHGKSHKFPPHLPIFSISYIAVYTIVTNYFKRNKYIIMAHSYGGQLGFLFAQLYPEKVEKLIIIDTLMLVPVSLKKFAKHLKGMFNLYFNAEEKLKNGKTPQYSYEEVINRIIEGRMSPITEDGAKVLAKRMLIPKDNGKYELANDLRLKFVMNPIYNEDYAVKILKCYPITCPTLIIFHTETDVLRQYYKQTVDALEQLKNVTIKYAPGFHDPQLNHPDQTAPIISAFLNNRNYRAKSKI